MSAFMCQPIDFSYPPTRVSLSNFKVTHVESSRNRFAGRFIAQKVGGQDGCMFMCVRAGVGMTDIDVSLLCRQAHS